MGSRNETLEDFLSVVNLCFTLYKIKKFVIFVKILQQDNEIR